MFDIDTDIPVIVEYAKGFNGHKEAMKEFITYLIDQTTDVSALKNRVVDAKDSYDSAKAVYQGVVFQRLREYGVIK